MSASQPWSKEIASYFAQLDGAPPSTEFDFITDRLPLGPHWGIIEGFNPDIPKSFDLTATTDRLLDEAETEGASIARVQVDWAELETAPGVYDQALLNDVLDEITSSDQAYFVTLSTLDSDGLTFPEYLLDPDTGQLRDGLTLSSPDVQNAFDGMLAWLIPQLSAAGVWGISIGNEVEIPVEDGLVSEEDAAVFFERGLAQVKLLDPDMAASVTLTAGAAQIAPDLTARIAEASDIFVVNFYGDSAEGIPTEEDWAEGLAIIKAMAAGKPIFFQELGMPVGYEDADLPGESTINSSLEIQASFFEFMGREIANDPQLLGATVFQLYDWSPTLLEFFLGGLDPDVFASFEEALATIGLVAWSDGAPRPAWSTWLDELGDAQAVRMFREKPIMEGDDAPNDVTVASPEGDVVFANGGRDNIRTGAADDAIDLGAGNDVAHSAQGDDVVMARAGKDTVFSAAGADRVNGGSGADIIRGGSGDDTLLGGAGNDTLFGGNAKDRLFGGNDNDRLNGGSGNDTLFGGGGNDLLNGGTGSDTFVFDPNTGDDTIRNGFDRTEAIFGTNDGAQDTIRIKNITDPDAVDIRIENGNTVFDYGDGSVVIEDFTFGTRFWRAEVVNGGVEYQYDSVICTHMHRHGLIPDDVFAWDGFYGRHVLGETVLRGYHLWAIPFVRHVLEKSPTATRLVAPVAQAWATEMAHRCDSVAHPRGSLWGRVILRLGVPLCGGLGWVAQVFHSQSEPSKIFRLYF